MRFLYCSLLFLAALAQGQTLCFSSQETCPEPPSIWFVVLPAPSIPHLLPVPTILPMYRPVVPLELSPVTKQFFMFGTAMKIPRTPMIPTTVPSSRQTPPAESTLPPITGGGITVNTGFGVH